jgi:transposase
MFDHVSFSEKVLRFHTSSSADQAGAVTTVRQASVSLTPDSISLGKHGPFALPSEVRDASEFRHLMELSDGAFRIPGLSKSPRKRPDWPILTYAYRLYADHIGVDTDRELPPVLARMIESKRQLWNAMCEHCERSIEKGQTITAEVLDSLAADVTTILTAFNNSLGRSKDKIAFPKDDATQIPAQRVSAYARFVSRLHHLAEEGKPVPDGLEMLVDAKLKQYPYDWAHFREFERYILRIGTELTKSIVIPASISGPVIQTYRAAFKRRRSMKLKGFDGIPHRKNSQSFDWFHEFSFGSGGIKVTRLNLKGSSSLRFGKPVPPQTSGHPLMQGRKAALRLLRPITFTIEEQEVTFAMMMHRPLPENGLLKQWRLLYRNGEYWINFMLEIPPYTEASSDAGGVAALDLNWRVLPAGGILLAMVTDGDEDTMIVFNMDRSSRASDEGGMIETYSEGAFSVVSLGVGPSRWGRNNIAKNVNYGVPDTFSGARKIRQLRDKAKDELKIRIDRMLGEEAPAYLSLFGPGGLKQLAHQLDTTHPDVSAEISQWAVYDEDILRVMRKLSGLLDGRVKRGYDQLAHHLCHRLSGKGIKRIAIKENFLKTVAEAEKKYQPPALQSSARYRQAVGASNWINALEHIAAKYGIVLSRRDAAHATTSCRFCKTTCDFGPHRTVQCPGCSRVIDQDQNAAHNLRNAELEDVNNPTPKEAVLEHAAPGFSWTLTIGRVTPDGELRQTRDLVLTAKAKESTKVNPDS